MGIVGQILGGGARDLTQTVGEVADGFRANATHSVQLGHEAYIAALDQHGSEFQYGRIGAFDKLMNGLNRLPRPMLALGTLGLFIFAMVDPTRFAVRMEGLAVVPDPLWWLLGAIVSFYFGARELHYARRPKLSPKKSNSNAAISAWQAERGG